MSFFDWIIKILSEYGPSFLRGTGYTLIMAIVGTVAGFIIGLLVSLVRVIPVSPSDSGFKKVLLKVVNFILSVYVEVIRGTPMMVQAMVIYWGYAFATGGKTLALIPSGSRRCFPQLSLFP